MDKVLLIDFQNQLYRAAITFGKPIAHEPAHWAEDEKNYPACACGSPWSVEDNFCYGERYGYVFNWFRNLRPQIEMFEPSKVFVVDEGHPQFRYDLYADYKANRIIKQASRAEQQTKVHAAKEIILSLMPHLPLTMARAEHYEADDTVASLCEDLKDEDLTVISSDNDYIQLLQRGYPKIQIYNPIKKKYLEAPEYAYIPWKCMAGDKSDNIPALLKPKKALDAVNDPELFKKFLEVEENRANFSVNRQLIEFRAVPAEEIILQEGQRNFQFLFDCFTQFKFETLTRKDTWERYTKTFDCIKY